MYGHLLTLGKCSDESEPPQEVVPNIPLEPNQIGIFFYTSERNFLNFWHTGKHSQFLPSKLNWDRILSHSEEAGGRCHTDLACMSFSEKLYCYQKKESKGDFGKRCLWHHVIPVKLADELSQPLDSLRMVVVTHSFSEVY